MNHFADFLEERHDRPFVGRLSPIRIGFRDGNSRGRVHGHDADPERGEFARDRDRIVHSRAFRRLQHKTQVFTWDQGDHFRNRLTHTIEVAQLARSAARRLHLNEDLVECVALVHDVGHPPFGHQGETMLDELLAEHGGFEHNRQGLRIVEELEVRYPEFPGLNLSYEVRESIIKHSAHYDRSRVPDRFHPEESPLLEAQLVDELDSVVYDCHDVDDGLRSGFLTLDALQEVSLWRGAWQEAIDASPRSTPERLLVDRAVRRLMDSLVNNLVTNTRASLMARGLTTVNGIRACPDQVVGLGAQMRDAKEGLEAWLFANLYRHYQVNRTFHRAKAMLADLFRFYIQHEDALPPEFAARIPVAGAQRVVVDYLSGMTDRYAVEEYRKLIG